MTKFEEEVKRPANGPLTELNNNMQEVFSQYRKMRQYADYLEYDSKQKDEYIIKLENENSFMRDERTTFDSNGMAVEPKLQQQAMPVVPEWLDKEIKQFKSVSKHPTVDVAFGVADAIVAVASRHYRDKLYDYLFCGRQDECNQHQAIFALAFITGKYEVEKQQLFYIALPNVYELKNKILVSKVENGTIAEFTKEKAYALKLTEQEIKSIDERYWQFAVPVEDGE